MGTAEDMKKLCEDIVTSYDMRIRAVGELVRDTRDMLREFEREHKERADNLRTDLATGNANRIKALKAVMAEAQKTIKGIVRGRKERADNLRTDLARGEDDRIRAFNAMMAEIQRTIKAIEDDVKKKLSQFSGAHADVSAKLKKVIRECLDEISEATQGMAANWQALTETMTRKRAGQPAVSALPETEAVGKAAQKPHQKKKGAKKKEKDIEEFATRLN
jgi:hypothetical protein